MRKRYGSWTAAMLAVLVVLGSWSSARAIINPKYYPTLSLRNWHLNPDGIQRVPTPAAGGERYFLVPVYIYNEVDTTFNPNTNGQHLEPIRSFEFQMTYLTQAMVLDTMHGSPIVMIGPDPTAQPALAKTFFTRYSDQPDLSTGNPYLHRIRIAAASSVPLPMANTSDSSGVLLWLRFKVVVSNVNAGLMQLDTSRFNDHPGDPQLNALTWPAGNFGGGSGVGGQSAKGQGLVQITAQPAFLFLPFSQITQIDNANYQLSVDMTYDPTNPGPNPSRSIQVSDAVGNTSLTNVSVCSDEPWLSVSTTGPGGQQCAFIPLIDYTQAFGSQQKNIFLTANPAGLTPGIYYGTVTFTSDGASNSPSRLRVRFIVLASPNEPKSGGTGIRLNITNSCNPTCTSTVTFGTGPGATAGIDLLYGEQPFSTNDKTTADTNVVVGQRCYAYFVPQDLTVDPAFQDPTFLGLNRDIRSDVTDTSLIYQVNFSAGDVNCYPVKVCVDPNDFPEGGRIVMRFTLNGNEQGIDLRTATLDQNNMRCVTISDRRINSFYIEYTPGSIGTVPTVLTNSWNLVSLPVIPPNPDARVIFSNASGLPYAYFASIGWEVPAAAQLEFGRGYMIKYGSYIGTNNLVAGVRSNQIRNVRIDEGWNTVGAASVASSTLGIYFTPLPGLTTIPQLVSDVWEFIPTRGYQQTSFLVPGKGYFIKVDQAGYYNLNVTGAAPQGSDFAGKIARESLQSQLSQVLVSDARNNGQALFFGNAQTSLSESRFEMPGAVQDLDARFATNHGNTSFNRSSYVIDLRAKSYPVSMNFTNLQGDVTVRDMNGNVLGTATNGGVVTITNPNVHQVEISQKSSNGTTGATGYQLEQNTPNPFGAVTTISYTTPAEAPVSLIVYNQLGEVVKTLVNEVVGAGRHEVQFTSNDLANGTYYYTLKAGDFVKTERMQISK